MAIATWMSCSNILNTVVGVLANASKAKHQTLSLKVSVLLLAFQISGIECRQILPFHMQALDSVPPTSTKGGSTGISGHGFMIASDNLIRHPLGPGTQPVMMSMTPNFPRNLARPYL